MYMKIYLFHIYEIKPKQLIHIENKHVYIIFWNLFVKTLFVDKTKNQDVYVYNYIYIY